MHISRHTKGAVLALSAWLLSTGLFAQVPNFTTLSGSGGLLDSTGTVTQLRGPAGLALNPSKTLLFEAEREGNVVRQIDIASRRAQTLAGRGYSINTPAGGIGKQVFFNFPSAIAYASDSIVYVADLAQGAGSNNRGGLYRLNTQTRRATLLAGLGGGSSGTGNQVNIGLANGMVVKTGTADTLYISSGINGLLEVIAGPTSAATLVRRIVRTGNGNPGWLQGPAGLAFYHDSLLVAEESSGRLSLVSRRDSGRRVVLTGLNRPMSVAVLADTALLVSEFGGNRITGIQPYLGLRFVLVSGLSGPSGLALADTALFFSEPAQNRIRYVTLGAGGFATRDFAGSPGTLFNGSPEVAAFNNPQDVTMAGDGNLYVADNANNAIRRVETATGAVTTLVASAVRAPNKITARGQWLYFTENTRNNTFRVSALNINTGRHIFLAGGSGLTVPAGTQIDGDSATSKLKYPSGVALNRAGTLLYFGSGTGASNEAGHVIRRINIATKTTTTIAGGYPTVVRGYKDTVGLEARFNDPVDVVADGDSVLYIADQGNDRIRKMDVRTGMVSTFIGSGSDINDNPRDAANGLQATIASIQSLYLDTVNRFLYFTDGQLLRRASIDGSRPVATGAGNTRDFADGLGRAALFNNPGGVTANANGSVLYLADGGNNRIRKATFLVNTAPSFLAGPNVDTVENAGFVVIPNWATAIRGGSQAAELGQMVRFEIQNDNPTLFNFGPRVDSIGTLRFRTAANRYGLANLRLRLRDNGGTGAGGIDTSTIQTFIISVDSVNSAPVFSLSTANQVVTVTGNGLAFNRISWAGGVAASSAPNSEGYQNLVFTVRTANPQFYTVQPRVGLAGNRPNFSGTLNFTPDTTRAGGTDTLTVVLRDNGGTLRTGIDSVTRRFVINITGIVALREPVEMAAIAAWPNPASGSISVSGLNASKAYTLTLVDMKGSLKYTANSRNTQRFAMPLTRMANGLYSLVVTGPAGVKVLKVLVLQ